MRHISNREKNILYVSFTSKRLKLHTAELRIHKLNSILCIEWYSLKDK